MHACADEKWAGERRGKIRLAGFRVPPRNVGMTNQIAATHKLHSTKSDSGSVANGVVFGERGASALSRAATKLGYSTLLPQQERVVRAFVQGRDVFVSLPTGSGSHFVTAFFLFFSTSCTGASGRVSSWWLVLSRALLHICLLELCSFFFLWLSVAAHVQRRRK